MRYGTMIIGTGTVCIIILAAIFYILFLNRESDSVAPILFKVVAAILAAVALLTLELLRAPDTMQAQSAFLVLRNKNGDLLDLAPVTTALNLSHHHGYSLLNQIWLFHCYEPETKPFTQNKKVFNELVTATFLKWLAYRYSTHWDINQDYIAGISGGGGGSSPKEDSDRETSVYEIQNSGNGFLIHDPVYHDIKMPKRSTASLIKDELEEVFSIKNPNMTFTFSARRLGSSGARYSILGNKLSNHLAASEELYSHNYVLTLKATFSRFWRWSPETNKQKEWMRQLFADFERDFNWETFKPEFQSALEEFPRDARLQCIPLKLVKADLQSTE